MGKLAFPALAIALACLLVISCKTTGTPAQSQPGQGPQSSVQAPQPPAGSAQPLVQPLAPAVRSAVRSVNAVYTRSVRPVFSAPIGYLADKFNELSRTKVKLFGVVLPPTELLAIVVAAAILVIGGTWTLSSMSRRR